MIRQESRSQGSVVSHLSVNLSDGSGAAQLEAGDRLELIVTGEPNRFCLPPHWDAAAEPIEAVEDLQGKPLEINVEPDLRRVTIPAATVLIGQRWPSLWLEYQQPGRYRLVLDDVSMPVSMPLDGAGAGVEEDSSGWLAGRTRRFATSGQPRAIPTWSPRRQAGRARRIRPPDPPSVVAGNGDTGASGAHGQNGAASAARPGAAVR